MRFYIWKLHVLFGKYIIFALETLENFIDFGKQSVYLDNSFGNFGKNPSTQAQIFWKVFFLDADLENFGKLS